MKQPIDVLINLVYGLNNTNNKSFFKRLAIKRRIYNAKRELKFILDKESYNALDIYNFLLFINYANISNLFTRIDNFQYFCYKPSDDGKLVSTGYISMSINYDTNNSLNIQFKPVIYDNQQYIDMEWIISTPDIACKNTYSISSTSYHSSVEHIQHKAANFYKYTDILEDRSYDILINIMTICIENIFNNIETRYLHEKEQ